jgi:hypothetical protein
MIVWLRHFLGWVFSALRSREVWFAKTQNAMFHVV